MSDGNHSQQDANDAGERRRRERALIEGALEGVIPLDETSARGKDPMPADVFPGYELIREIHRGGQGAVYLAIQKATKRRVAIKLMHSGPLLGSAGRIRFEREVQILAHLNHPNIVKIFDSGVTAAGSFFYVMDYISGRSLDEVISSGSRPIEESLRLFVKICDAVNAAHLKGVIHRDLKPSNIRVDPSGEPIVVDFGLAKLSAGDVSSPDGEAGPSAMTMTGQFVGSLPWASPEQAEGAPGGVDVRTDVYSLGVVLYQLLTGRFPYEVAGNMRDVLDNILRAQPARPSTVRRQINDEVETIVLKCLAKERERRYQSAGDLSRDLKRYLSGEPIEAKRDSGWYVITKTMNRHRAAVIAAALVLVAIIGVAAWMSVLYRSAERERLTADRERRRASANFDAARGMARTFMFDFADEIRNLRGATRARERVLTEAAAYIEKLTPQAEGDVSLQLELADAHDRLGDLRGGLYLASTGTAKLAQESYSKAFEIRAALSKLPSPDPATRCLVDAGLGRSYYRLSASKIERLDFEGAEADASAAISSFDSALAGLAAAGAGTGRAAGAIPDRASLELSRAWARLRLGDTWFRRAQKAADEAKAREWLAKADAEYRAVAADLDARGAPDADVARLSGVTRDKISAATLVGASHARRAGEKLPAGGQDRDALLDRASRLAEQARSEAQAAGDRFASLANAHPENGQLARDRWLALHNMGASLMELALVRAAQGKDAEATESRRLALGLFGQALEIAEGLARSDEANAEAQRDVALCLNKVGNMQRDLGMLGDALETFRRSLRQREVVFRTDPIQQHQLDLGRGYFKVGEVLARTGDKPGAAEQFRRCLSVFEALRDQGAMEADSEDLATVRRMLADVGG